MARGPRRRRRPGRRHHRQRRRVLLRPRPRAGRRRGALDDRAVGAGADARREGLGRTVPPRPALRHRQARHRRGQRGRGRARGCRWRWPRTSGSPPTRARLHPGYLRAGTSPDGGLTWSLPTLVGHQAAMRFLLESRFVRRRRGPAPRARVGGRPRRRSSTSGCWSSATAVAAQAPLAVRRTKRLVARAPLVTDVDARMTDEIRTRSPGSTARTDRRRCGRSWRSARPSSAGADVADRGRAAAGRGRRASSTCCGTSARRRVGRTHARLVRAGGLRRHRARPHHQRRRADAPAGSRLHSLHAHFLRPVQGGQEIAVPHARS